MTPKLWERVQNVLFHALQLPAEDRTAFLDTECVGAPDLRREVESLLETDELTEAQGFIEDTPAAGSRPGSESPQPLEERYIGDYEIVRQLKTGGMGTVYLGKRTREFEMQVAIKVLKRDLVNEELVRRFREERRILARLEHAHIAKLFDGGTTKGGRPFLVMEYIEGEPIDTYCDRNKLSLPDRLRLFRKVCAAVSYAHGNLVVHRDLKPNNILVTPDGEPKLLDFGIAKILQSSAPAGGTSTPAFGTLPGNQPMTARYASPEQVANRTITTASDVYALGVLLFELLAGHYPYRISSFSFLEYVLAVRNQEPHKPSAVTDQPELVLQTDRTISEVPPESISALRGCTPRRLRGQLRGDLDSILLKSLRKERQQRYASVEQLSEDLKNHLEGKPVMAHRGSFRYTLGKFIGRYKIQLTTVFIVAFLAVLAGYAHFQRQIERRATQRLLSFTTMLIDVDPAGEEPGFEAWIRSEVDRSVDSEKLADLLDELAEAIEDKGGFLKAGIIYREAYEMQKRIFGEEHENVALALNNLAAAVASQGKYEEAEGLYREALRIKNKLHEPSSEARVSTLNNLAVLLQDSGQLTAARPLCEESLRIRLSTYGPTHWKVALARNTLGYQRYLEGAYQAAEEEYSQALGIVRESLGEHHEAVGYVLKNVAMVQLAAGDYGAAEESALRALAILRGKFGHWRLADTESVLGEALYLQGRYEEAEPLLQRSLHILREAKGVNSREFKMASDRLGELSRVTGGVQDLE